MSVDTVGSSPGGIVIVEMRKGSIVRVNAKSIASYYTLAEAK
jgi:hypothetical protein